MRRILSVNLAIAGSLNVPLSILADGSYLNQIQDILAVEKGEVLVELKEMIGALKPTQLEKDAESDLLVIPGYGSRKRFLANIGNLPERIADSFSGNLVILHFDR